MTRVQITALERQFGRAALGIAMVEGGPAQTNYVRVYPGMEEWKVGESLHRRGLVVKDEGVRGALGRAYRLTRDFAHACLNPGETLGEDLDRFPLMDAADAFDHAAMNPAEFRADAVSAVRTHDFGTICDALAAVGFNVETITSKGGCIAIQLEDRT